MKITNCTTFLVEGIKYNWTLLKIETDAGIHGWGEATNWPGSPLVEAACRHVGEFIVGQDARRIDYLWTKVYRDMNWLGQAGPLLSAISAMDIALWDIKGKATGQPVYQLLGGSYRSKIQLYANYWFISGDHTPEAYARQAQETVAQGFTALKFDPFAHVNYWYGEDLSDNNGLTEKQKRLALDVVDAVAKAAGPEVQIAIETHAFLNGPTAVEMAGRLAKLGFNCMWYEEPALPEFPDSIADIRRKISLPVCVGERLHSRFMLKTILEKQAADIVMPDITRCGGISEMRKMANLAETFNVPIAPHNPNGPISTIASAHTMATVPNFYRQEFMLKDVPWRDECLSHPLPVENGFFVLPDRPGLGFDIDESVLEMHPGLRVPPSNRAFYI
ncbi:MAG: galactonate dehydratase [Verrucomicrobia bacterium 61-8]|nr:mandelate racemase/muconate lactonizing enzyme family protein [Verrucomicrobiota bacterium]OJV25376.1 MAG: galactonate dehydratase [Verrucomicrobia bacterium 61-8]